jgi:hypothetical protein
LGDVAACGELSVATGADDSVSGAAVGDVLTAGADAASCALVTGFLAACFAFFAVGAAVEMLVEG